MNDKELMIKLQQQDSKDQKLISDEQKSRVTTKKTIKNSGFTTSSRNNKNKRS
jgi:hypothetical protein